MTQPERPKPDVLRMKAKHHREMAKELLIWSAKLEAEARLIIEGIENPSTELIEQEARGTRAGPGPLVITSEAYKKNPNKYTAVTKERNVHLTDAEGKVTAILSTPNRPLGLGYDIDSAEEIW